MQVLLGGAFFLFYLGSLIGVYILTNKNFCENIGGLVVDNTCINSSIINYIKYNKLFCKKDPLSPNIICSPENEEIPYFEVIGDKNGNGTEGMED